MEPSYPIENWNSYWIVVGLILLVALIFCLFKGQNWLLKLWFSNGPKTATGEIHSVYKVYGNEYPTRAKLGFLFGLLGGYYASYVIISLSMNELSKTQERLHTALWTLGPPLWFFCEWFILFDNHDNEKALAQFKEGQSASAKVWAAVLLVLAAYQITVCAK
jgi:hypothetical protein